MFPVLRSAVLRNEKRNLNKFKDDLRMENKQKDLSVEERYYFWLMVSLGFVKELEDYIKQYG